VLKLEDDEGTSVQRQVHGWSPIPSVGDIALIQSAEGDPYVPEADQVGTVQKLLDSSASGLWWRSRMRRRIPVPSGP
jgi:hypothetical protein